MTRAKKKLYLSYHVKNDNGQDIVPSLFVSEISHHEGLELVDYTESSAVNGQRSTEITSDTVKEDEIEKLKLKFIPRDDFVITQEAEYIDSLLKDYKLSITHLNNYLECPRKFFYQNLLRVPSAKNKHACFGTAVHEALFDLFVHLKTVNGQRSKVNGLELLLERFEEHLKEENLPEQEYTDSLGVGTKALTEYYEQYKIQFITQTELEYDFSSKGVNLNGIVLTGKLDKIEILDPVTKSVNVVDYKTGNPNSKAQSLNPGGDYHRQIVFYQLLCDQGYKSGQFPYTMQSGEIDFIQPGYGNKFIKKKIEVRNEDLDHLKEEIASMYTAVKEHKFDKTSELETCTMCSFKNICGR
jgi:DNA helicase-2/ATP-dependent DNA helicase PcrA